VACSRTRRTIQHVRFTPCSPHPRAKSLILIGCEPPGDKPTSHPCSHVLLPKSVLTKLAVQPRLQTESCIHVSRQRVVGNTEVGPHVDQAVLREVQIPVHGDGRVGLPEQVQIAAVVCPCQFRLISGLCGRGGRTLVFDREHRKSSLSFSWIVRAVPVTGRGGL
jgi:hypothetical protein